MLHSRATHWLHVPALPVLPDELVPIMKAYQKIVPSFPMPFVIKDGIIRLPIRYEQTVDDKQRHLFEAVNGHELRIIVASPAAIYSGRKSKVFIGTVPFIISKVKRYPVSPSIASILFEYTKPDPKKPTPKNNSKK